MLETVELEAALVGSLLLRDDALYELPPAFSPEALAHTGARRAYEAISRLVAAKKRPEISLVVAEGRLTDSEANWLRGAVANHSTTNSVAAYGEQLLDRHRRAQLRAALQAAANALQGDAETGEVVGGLTARLLDLDRPERAESLTWKEASMAAIDALESTKLAQGAVLRSGFASLDAVVKIRRGNLVVLAARPGVGKSTLALNIAENVALAGGPVLFHSLEMDDVELVGRVLSRATRIHAERYFDDAPFSPAEWERTANAVASRADRELPLHMNTAHHSLGAVCRITEKMHRKHKLALVVVDYLQLVEVDLGKNATDESRIGTVSRTLKLLAQRLQVPVVAVAQLNREVEKRKAEDGKVPAPRLSDLRGSGRIEQDANTVLFLGNPYADSADREARTHGPFEVTVAKQRLGRRGVVALRADLAFAEFSELKHQPHFTEGDRE